MQACSQSIPGKHLQANPPSSPALGKKSQIGNQLQKIYSRKTSRGKPLFPFWWWVGVKKIQTFQAFTSLCLRFYGGGLV